jgi:hypothetical protein
MCQPKDKGGKRCLLHSAASKFIMRVVGIKTGASQAMIKDAIRELAREGKKGEAPSVDEVLQWLELRRFATEIDPDLDAHERKIQLNQIDKAKVEAVEQGVTASAWHAWKNLKKRVSLKMKSMKRAAVAIGLSGVLTLGLAGCVGGGGVTDNTPAPTSTSTSQPSDTPTSAPVDAKYGDLIPLTDGEGKAVTVTDEYGTYTRTTLSADDNAMTVNPATVDPSVTQAGWTDTDVTSAQQFVAKFVAQETLDSRALDTANGWEEWKKDEGTRFVNTQYINLNDKAPNSDRSAFILNNMNGTVPVATRDGGSRIQNANVEITQLKNVSQDGVNYITVTGTGTASYRVTDEAMIESFLKANPDSTRESVISENPIFNDGVEGSLNYDVSFDYTVEKTTSGEGWVIAGFQTNYNPTFK